MTQSASSPAPAPDRARGLGRIGVWSGELRFGDRGQALEAAAELDELGYGALWTPGGIGGDVAGDLEQLLGATHRTTIAIGILNIWKHAPEEIGAWWRGRTAAEQGRLMMGLGVSHGPMIGAAYAKPLEAMSGFLDGLDAVGLPAERRCLAALGPKMLDLAAARTAGSHPYLVTPQHTAQARERMGPAALLAPEQGVILETDPARARDIARQALPTYLRLPNYRNSWLRLGFPEAEIDGQSDRFIDAVFAWGTPQRIGARVQEHFDAGADHVCLQVLRGAAGGAGMPLDAWRQLAAALL